MTKRALILGVGGQDGSYLCDILLEKGYEVHGLYRRSSVDNLTRIAHVRERVTLHAGDVTDPSSQDVAFMRSSPHEVYHVADQDEVGHSFAAPGVAVAVTYGGTVNVLEAVRRCCPAARVFIPSSATVFGDAPPPQSESTPFDPRSPYACAKAAAYYAARMYREHYGLFVACGIMFNHDSPRRGGGYLLQRIARGQPLWGDTEAVVDIGYAREYMEAAWRMMQLDTPDDFVLGTGVGYRIKDLVEGVKAWDFPNAGLVADISKARRVLGFNPVHDAASVLEMIRNTERGL